jgi:transglutaminase-like putative cysteine protease
LRINVGCELVYELPQPTPMILLLTIHHIHASDLVVADLLKTEPELANQTYRDIYGNWCTRLLLPAGRTRISTDAIVACQPTPDEVAPSALEVPVHQLPAETIQYLLGSRYCETDRLSEMAWDLFGNSRPGWNRVKTICDYVHNAIRFDYSAAYPTKSAVNVVEERAGVCRDFTHLAIAFCRCLNIPARYCSGYLPDIEVPPADEPMDFSAWMEVYLTDRWFIFDPRNNARRIGRILVSRGRDAADIPLTHAFGFNRLETFRVWADQVG